MRLILILIVAGGIAAGWIVLQEKQAEAHLAGWAKQLSAHLEPQAHGAAFKLDPTLPDERNFFRILHFLHRIESEKLDMNKVIPDALAVLNVQGEAAAVTVSTLVANYEMGKKLDIFSDSSNLIKLEAGEAPIMKLKGWEGEPVAVGQVVPPTEAPALANRLPNLVLLPASVRDARSGMPAADSEEAVRQLQRGGFIERGTMEMLLLTNKKKK